jgi:hypothetical protein
MKKSYKNTEFTEKRCGSCGKPSKKNLLAKNPKANLCYHCFYPTEMRRRGVNVHAS